MAGFSHLNFRPGQRLRRLRLGLLLMLAACGFQQSISAQSILFTELNYNSDSVVDPGNWIELYNPANTAQDLTGWYLKDSNPLNRYDFPGGTSLGPGEYLVVCSDLADFAVVHPTVLNALGGLGFGLANGGETITLYDASDQPVEALSYEDSIPWPQCADGEGRTLERLDYAGPANDPSNWFDGCMFGSPGRAWQPCDPPLVFSEINYNPPFDAATDAGDWVELFNRGNAPVLLGGYTFRDQRDTNLLTIPAGTILNPGAYLLLVRDQAKFTSVHPGVGPFVGDFGFNLSGDGEVIRLYDPTGAIVFSTFYNDALPWPLPPDGFGPTLELLDATGRMSRWDNWFDGCPLGSPGTAFEPWCWATGTEDPAALPANTFRAWALPGAVELDWRSTENGRVRIFDGAGRLVLEQSIQKGQQRLNLPGAGWHLLHMHSPAGEARKAVWVPRP